MDDFITQIQCEEAYNPELAKGEGGVDEPQPDIPGIEPDEDFPF